VPELPEVETVVRTLAPRLRGRRIERAEFFSKHVVKQDFAEVAARLAGQRITAIERRGKFIVVRLSEGTLTIHLGMTGKLLLAGKPGPYARAIFHLDKGMLVYDDIRHFGKIEWSLDLPKRVAALGPEPLSVTPAELQTMLRKRHSRIKPLLLNQRFLRGMGNIYTDEALFLARIHPLALASRLGKQRSARLHQAITDVLTAAIEHKGSSISDYVDADGRKGTFQLRHQVYGREGEPCTNCGKPIRRIVVGQRGTHYCPGCQRV
jgi:formamidopyrimidine-DNA glycosylase